MAIYYHGTSRLFAKFDLAHILTGTARTKFGFGVYVSEAYETAAHYAGTKDTNHLVYTIECTNLTMDNHIISARPVNEHIIRRAEDILGATVPREVCNAGKVFRKYIGNTLIGNIGKWDSASIDAEKAASEFLLKIDVRFLVWPRAQTEPEGAINLAILDPTEIKIIKIEHIDLDKDMRFIPNSNKEIHYEFLQHSSIY